MDTNTKGDIAEVAIAASLTKAGYFVLIPQRKALRYDLAVDCGGNFKRIQCKWANLKNGAVVIRTQSCSHGFNGEKNLRVYTDDEIDFVAAYCMELDECFIIPVEHVSGKTAIQLRVEPTRNGQRKGVWEAEDFVVRDGVLT